MKTILANMRCAVGNRETVTIANGIFSPGEIQEVVLALEGREALARQLERERAKRLQRTAELLERCEWLWRRGRTERAKKRRWRRIHRLYKGIREAITKAKETP